MSVFGDNKVINARACFGIGADRCIANLLWFVKHQKFYIEGDAPRSVYADINRGSLLLRVVENHQLRLAERNARTTQRPTEIFYTNKVSLRMPDGPEVA